jgi:MoxR-like ATPase
MEQIGYNIQQVSQEVHAASAVVEQLRHNFQKIIVGQDYMMDRLLIGLLTKGHILLEGMPGLAKTLAIKTLAHSINAQFRRIQFTPDLLPADVIGTLIYNPMDRVFEVRKGPIFANFILADEINRAPAKVQAALLEAMQERQVTIGDQPYTLEEPFLVLATQNPIDQEGTYPLPEAQLDRFMLKVHLDYPSRSEELAIIRKNMDDSIHIPVPQVLSKEQIIELRRLVKLIYLDEKIEQYILDIIFSTRQPESYKLTKIKPLVEYGASPRASINLALAAKAHAFIQRRAYVIPEDVRAIAHDVMRHRIGLTYEAEAENLDQEWIINEVLNSVQVP